MLLPISWLRTLVDLEGIDNDTIEKSLFSCGLEVEERALFVGDVQGVVVGELLSVCKMENSEHLQICRVNCGTYGEDIQIVTGASNIKAGDRVPVALHGATVYGKEGKVVTIKNGKLLGTPSNGMLCSGEELGIDDDWYEGAGVYGILILAPDAPIGADVREVLELNDEVWDISVTANLPHCQSVWGIARELSALLNREAQAPVLDYTATAEGKENISVTVEAPDLCPRYIAHYVKDIRIAPSPRWMRRRLILTGHKPINTIVDITNYVLTELGQPMHAFDLSTLAGEKIVVRRARDGEPITTLDEHEFRLTEGNLVICDAEKPVALAGVMGGLNSEIRPDTSEVLFECAKFMRDNIRRTSRALGQSSDSSRRYEKGVDEYTTERAIARALHLVQELECGTVTTTHVDCRAAAPVPTVITTTFEKINGVLGIEVPRREIISILERMNYDVIAVDDLITVTAPGYREDIEDYPDLAEDVIKMYGYEHITPRLMEGSAITAGGYSLLQSQTLAAKEALVRQGFFELINYSFYSEEELALLRLPEGDPRLNVVRIENPLSEKYGIMRTTLIPSLLGIVSHNGKRGHEDGRFFELANIFTPSGEKGVLPTERQTLTLALWGKEESFFTAKGALEALEDAFGLTFTYERGSESFLHPGATARVFLGGEEIGVLGQVSYECVEDFEIQGSVFVCELNYEALSAHFPELIRYTPIPKFPSVVRDLALVADEQVSCGEITEVIRSACKSVTEVRLFDVYRSEQIGAGKKSMAFGLTFTPTGDTPLSGEAVDKFVEKILKSLAYRLQIAIR